MTDEKQDDTDISREFIQDSPKQQLNSKDSCNPKDTLTV